MAGATNRALKAAGIPKSTIATLRVEHGSGLSLRSALGIAHERGLPVGKAAEFHAAREAKHAASPAGQAAAADFRAKATTALKAAGERKAALRGAMMARAKIGLRVGSQLQATRKAMAEPAGAMMNRDSRLTPKAQAVANMVKGGQTIVVRTGDANKRRVYEIRRTADGGAELGTYLKRPGSKMGDKDPIKFPKAEDAVHLLAKNVPASAIDQAVRRYATPSAKPQRESIQEEAARLISYGSRRARANQKDWIGGPRDKNGHPF